MNFREFCCAASYDTAIFLTYSFDPIFFERVVLRELNAGGSGEVLVIVDKTQVEASIARTQGQLRDLGRRYRVVPAAIPGYQHAKMFFKLGRKGALFWIGSNNLTAAGCGGNRELASAWSIAPDDTEALALLRSLLRKIAWVAAGKDAAAVLARAVDHPLLSSAQSPNASRVLVSESHMPLAEQLKQRWAGRKFERLRLLTGSTDREGAFLQWAARTFAIKDFVVGVAPAFSAFEPEKLAKLPFSVQIAALPSAPRPHAKFYWFEGQDGCAAIVGSANCSAAAWLAPPQTGGNIEAVLIFDQCKEGDFQESLEPLQSTIAQAPMTVVGFGTEVEKEKKTAPTEETPRLEELSWSASQNELTAVTSTLSEQPEAVFVEFDGLRTKLEPQGPNGWVCFSPEFPRSEGTLFGRLALRYPGGRTTYTTTRWLDEQDRLEYAARGRFMAEAIPQLAASFEKPSEHRKVVEALSEIASALFRKDAFPDSVPVEKPVPKKEEAPRPPVDPNELVRRLTEQEEKGALSSMGVSAPGLSLAGVMRALFPDDDEQTLVDEEPVEDTDNDKQPPAPTVKKAATPPTESLRKRLVKMIEDFLKKLSQPEFARDCTVGQLVQAVAYPLAVAARGSEGGWIDAAKAASWVVQVTDLLFRSVNTPGQEGLLRAVQERYRAGGREEQFERAAGDGTLWVALVAALSRIDWAKEGRQLERAFALREVFEAPGLYARTDIVRLGGLLSRLARNEQQQSILEDARQASGALNEVERYLEAKFEATKAAQRGLIHQNGDPIWNPGNGLARAQGASPIKERYKLSAYSHREGKVVTVYADFFVNLRLLAGTDRNFHRLLAVASLDK